MKTIREVAEQLNVSKTAVRKEILNLGMQTRLHKKGNQFLIDEEQEKAILKAFKERTQTKKETETKTETKTENELSLRYIEHLQEQLRIKDEQLKAKDEQISNLIEKIDQEQKLHLATIQEKQQLQIELKETKEDKKPFWKLWG